MRPSIVKPHMSLFPGVQSFVRWSTFATTGYILYLTVVFTAMILLDRPEGDMFDQVIGSNDAWNVTWSWIGLLPWLTYAVASVVIMRHRHLSAKIWLIGASIHTLLAMIPFNQFDPWALLIPAVVTISALWVLRSPDDPPTSETAGLEADTAPVVLISRYLIFATTISYAAYCAWLYRWVIVDMPEGPLLLIGVVGFPFFVFIDTIAAFLPYLFATRLMPYDSRNAISWLIIGMVINTLRLMGVFKMPLTAAPLTFLIPAIVAILLARKRGFGIWSARI